MSDLALIVKELVEDIQDKQLWYERARQERSGERMNVNQHQMLGLKVGLGRVLALMQDGKTGLGATEAIFVANAYLAQLP